MTPWAAVLVRVVARPQQRRRARARHTGMPGRGSRSRSNGRRLRKKSHALDRFEAELVVDQHGDAGRSQPFRPCRLADVEPASMLRGPAWRTASHSPLLQRERAGRGADDAWRALHPASRRRCGCARRPQSMPCSVSWRRATRPAWSAISAQSARPCAACLDPADGASRRHPQPPRVVCPTTRHSASSGTRPATSVGGMRRAHTVEQVRAAEAALMARLPEGALMQRAAAGLAYAVIDLLGGGVRAAGAAARRAGDNGGDALYAGALLARRGCAGRGVAALRPARTRAGWLRCRRAGGRVVTRAPRRRAPDLVGRRDRRDRRAAGAAARGAVAALTRARRRARSSRSTPRQRRRRRHRRAGRAARTADVTVTFGTHKVAHLVDPAAGVRGVVHLVDIGLDLPDAGRRGAPARRRRGPAAAAGPDAQKYTRGVVGVRAGSAAVPRRRRALRRRRRQRAGRDGAVRRRRGRRRCVAAHPEVVGEGRVQAWVVGSGGGDDAGDELGRGAGATACRWSSTPTRSPTSTSR